MSRETKRVEIQGHRYELTQLGAKDGRRVLARLMTRLAESTGSLGDDIGKDEAAVGLAIATKALKVFDEDTVDWLCEVFGPATRLHVDEKGRDGKPVHREPELIGPVFDDHFAGRYDAMAQWIVASIQHNFASFLGGLLGGKLIGALGASASKSPST